MSLPNHAKLRAHRGAPVQERDTEHQPAAEGWGDGEGYRGGLAGAELVSGVMSLIVCLQVHRGRQEVVQLSGRTNLTGQGTTARAVPCSVEVAEPIAIQAALEDKAQIADPAVHVKVVATRVPDGLPAAAAGAPGPERLKGKHAVSLP